MSEDKKHEGHKENAGDDVAEGDVDAKSGADESGVLSTGGQTAPDRPDSGAGGEHDAQQYHAVQEAKRILMPQTAIVKPGSEIYQHLTEHDGIQRVIEMCMKYADEGITYPIGMIREQACIVDGKVLLYIVPLATVTEIEVWFVAKEKLIVRGVFTLELLDSETLEELEGDFVQKIAEGVQRRKNRLH